MKSMICILLSVVALATPVSAGTLDETEKRAAAVSAAAEPAQAPAPACKKKKKGLGGLLRAARSSGLVSVVAGRAGTGGALVNSVTNTAIDVADASKRMAPEQPKC